MKKLDEMTREGVRKLVSYQIFERGVEYFAEGHVIEPSVSGNKIMAEVKGSSYKNYRTSVELANGQLECKCDCPYDWGTCKHVIALLLHWVKKRDDFEDLGHVAENMEKMPRDGLLKILRRFAKDEPQRFVEIVDLALVGEIADETKAPDFVKKTKNILRNGDDRRISDVVKRVSIIHEQALGRLKSNGASYAADQLFRIACAFLDAPWVCEDSNGEGIGLVSELLDDVRLIWMNYKISKKVKKEILDETWKIINADTTLLTDSFDDFFESICKGEWERKSMRKPIVQRLVQLEELESSGRQYKSYRYEQTLHFARKFGYISQKGVYIQD